MAFLSKSLLFKDEEQGKKKRTRQVQKRGCFKISHPKESLSLKFTPAIQLKALKIQRSEQKYNHSGKYHNSGKDNTFSL